MFWLIDSGSAHGARSGLITLLKQTILGIFKGGESSASCAMACEYNSEMNCFTKANITRRLVNLMMHGEFFLFQ